MQPDDAFLRKVRSVQLGSLGIGVVGAVLAAIGYFFSPQAFFSAYLVAFLFWLGISLGSLAVAMIHHLSGGGWGLAIRRILEAAYSLLSLMALLFLPLLLGLEQLYPWARSEVVEHDEILQRKAAYLNVSAFTYRAIAYFAVWILVGFLLSWISARSDVETEYARRRRLALLAGPGLIAWVLCVTFSTVDWGMSLEPHWFSSMYGVLYIAGYGVSGLATALITLIWLSDRYPVTEFYNTPRQHDLGNLLLAFVLFWSYVSFSQYLIIWSGNLPEEAPWYLVRGAMMWESEAGQRSIGWGVVALLLIGLHFLVPFLLLLSRETKQDPRWLVGIAALLLIMRFVDLNWLIVPPFSQRLIFPWLSIVLALAIGGFWVAAFLWRLTARVQLPVVDLPAEEETLDDVATARAH